MNTDRRAILELIAMGRITPSEAERLLAAWNESRETTWVLIGAFALALIAQLHMHELLPMLKYLIPTQLPALANTLNPVIDIMGGQR